MKAAAVPTANEQLRSLAIRRAVLLERLRVGEVRRVIALYAELEGDLVAQLAKRDPMEVNGRYRTARLTVLLSEVSDTLVEFGKSRNLETMAILRRFSTAELLAAQAEVTAATGGAVLTSAPSAASVFAVVRSRPFQGRFLRDWFRELDDATKSRVTSAIRMGVLQGETIGQITRRVRLATRQSARSAAMVVRTAITHVSAVARGQVYSENRDLLKGVQWVSTLDDRTSDICIDLDGKVFPVDSGPRPPAHPNCRSSVAPVLKSWRELGVPADSPPEVRASMNGQVPGTMTYREWLKSQPTEVQDEVLGRRRAQAFRAGEAGDVDLVDQSSRAMSVSDLGTRRSG
jgi:SPP1 gp7 family putative phage head morphogenesis protein